jgi:hypothetical protein
MGALVLCLQAGRPKASLRGRRRRVRVWSPFDLHVLVGPERAVANLLYDRDCVGKEENDQALAIYRSILDSFLHRDRAVFIYGLPARGRASKILHDFNRTQVHLDPYCLLHQPFEVIASRKPERTGILFQEHAISYGDLNSQANRLAHLLLRRDPLAPDDGRNRRRAGAVRRRRHPRGRQGGAADVPVDPRYPAERQAFIILQTRVPASSLPIGPIRTSKVSVSRSSTCRQPNRLRHVHFRVDRTTQRSDDRASLNCESEPSSKTSCGITISRCRTVTEGSRSFSTASPLWVPRRCRAPSPGSGCRRPCGVDSAPQRGRKLSGTDARARAAAGRWRGAHDRATVDAGARA